MVDGGVQGRGEERRNGAHHVKLCARGHWRPHEDAQLKELVSHYGPQNWNLIAEKLPGRSGNFFYLFTFSVTIINQIYAIYLIRQKMLLFVVLVSF